MAASTLVHALALKQTGREAEGRKLLTDWAGREPESPAAAWALRAYDGEVGPLPEGAGEDARVLAAWLAPATMRRLLALPMALLALAGLDGGLAEARVVRVTIERRESVLAGKPFGLAGPYETLVGTVELALDPSLRQNRAVVDLALAPRNERGEVVFTADVFILKPVDLRRGNGRVYYEVPNRGGKGILRRLQYAEASLDPREPADFGDGWLMEQGFSLAWMGWQWDVPEQPGLLRLRAPIATAGGRPIEGLVRSVVIVGEKKDEAPLADSSHLAYPPVDPEGRDSRLYVRDHRLAAPHLLPRKSWRFAGPSKVVLDGGFEPGRIYEVVYRSRDPRVAGCGFAATRDLVSFFKNEASAANPLAGVTLAVGHGISQSGRFLRHFLHQGFNEDEQGRRVFDGVFVEVAGAGHGSFNHRFAQASRDGHQHWNVHYPTDVFPFTDLPETDPETGETAGLLDREVASGTVPKLIHVVTSYEYWNRAASLMHTDPSGTRDVALPDTSRAYLVASAQHGPGTLPPAEGGANGNDGLYPTNPNDFRPAIRALVRALDALGGPGRRAATEPVPPHRRRHARSARESRLAGRAGRPLPDRAERARPDGLRPRVGARRDHDRAAAARPGLPRPRARGRRGRQRSGGHPPARDRGAARLADGLELASPPGGRPGRARGVPRLVPAVRLDEGGARGEGRPAPLRRGALPRARGLPGPGGARGHGARARALPAPAGRGLRHRAGRRPLGLAQRERPRRLIAPPSRGRRPCRARRAASDRRAGRRPASRSRPRRSCPSPSTRG